MTKSQLEEYGAKEAVHIYKPDHHVSYFNGFKAACDLLWPLVVALNYECGGRCAKGLNPCAALQTLDDLEAKVRGGADE